MGEKVCPRFNEYLGQDCLFLVYFFYDLGISWNKKVSSWEKLGKNVGKTWNF
jgi:hypothetical protein